ncbi:MAG: 4Fe-4S binding protein [Syntrophales bacterium]|jgi:dissimilatory sulfite reductase (desulfoviridin) alpha/beta subunit|nr:4Fe-4S binding protein [Syntrophales bacterium]MDY0043124.1 4Fe-4S binding protein [Syntrophales bacterium]
MPWINDELCNGCGICVEQCPVDTIAISDYVAEIDMTKCIRCGTCHEICPVDAVCHDKKRIPCEVTVNVEKTKANMEACAKYLGNSQERQKCLVRWITHYENIITIAEKTLNELRNLKTLQ